MGLNQRSRILAALVLAVSLVLACLGCGAPQAGPSAPHASTIRRASRHPNAPTILVLMPETPQVAVLFAKVADELSAEFDVVTTRIEKDSSVSEISRALAENHPACIVLMNNSTVRLYHQYQEGMAKSAAFPPAVIVMSSFLDQTYRSIRNATGIAYEVPGVIQFVKLRSIIARPVRRVGVVYRSPFSAFITKQHELARVEEIDLVGVQVGREPGEAEVSAALRGLVEDERVDALWVLNDNGLLTQRMISEVWVPAARKYERTPVIVGVRMLIDKNQHVGSFAMVPDDAALGMQTANLVFELAENGWKLNHDGISFPISLKTVVDVTQARNQFGLRKGGLEAIDELIE